MQQEIRPLLAVDIIEQLHKQFAILSGRKLATFPFSLLDAAWNMKKCFVMEYFVWVLM